MVLDASIPFSLNIPMVGGLSTKEPSEIADNEFQVAEYVRFDDGVAEKAPAATKLNPSNQLESGAKLDGVWRSNSDKGVSRLVVVCNGKVYESSDWTTPIYTGLTAGKRCTFRNYRGVTIISNGSDAPIVYDPTNNKVIGKLVIQGPKQVKKIAYFEADETGWSGGTADTETHVYDELTGDSLQGRKLTATAGNTVSMEWGSLSLNLSQYGDTQTVDGWDFVDISLYHKIWKNVKEIVLYFETSVGNHYSYKFGRSKLDLNEDGKSQERNFQWTHFPIRRNRFTATGAPNWNNITKIKISLEAEATGTAEVTFDNYRLRRTSPVAGPLRLDIGTFEPSEETWTGGVLDVDTPRPDGYSGVCSRKLTNGDATTSAPITLNVLNWPNGRVPSYSDEIHIWAKVNDPTKLTSIKIKLGNSDLTAHYHYTWTVAGGDFEDGTDIWNDLTAALTDFNTVGAPSWTNIQKVQIEGVIAAGGSVHLDDVALLPKPDTKTFCEVEKYGANQTWTVSPTGKANWNNQHTGAGNWSIRYDTGLGSPVYAQVVFDAGFEKDLTKWDDGSESTEADTFAFWFYHPACRSVPQIMDIYIDCNTGDFSTDYYHRRLDPAFFLYHWPAVDWIVEVAKDGFTRYGTSPGKGWNTVKGIKIQIRYVKLWEWQEPSWEYWIDWFHMRRSSTNSYSGRYRWKTVFKYGDLRSPASEATDWLDLTSEVAYLKKVPTSADSRVTQREIYRQSAEDIYEPGGETFYLAGTIYNNTTTEYVDDLYEPGLSMDEMGVPEGTFEDPKGVVVTEFKDQIILLQILEELKGIKYSSFANIHAWSDLGGRDFPSEVVSGMTHFDNFFVFCRDGHVHQVADDIAEGGAAPLGQLVKAVSPWGVCKVEEEIGVVTEKDIKLFSGYGCRSIGEAIEDYLDPANWKVEESVLFYHQKHLYYIVESRTSGRKFLDCYVPSGAWSDGKLSLNCICRYDGKADKGELVAGGIDGYVYQIDTGYSTGTLKIRSKDYGVVQDESGNTGYLFHEKEIEECRVIARGMDASSGSITIKFYINGADSGISITKPVTGHLNTRYTTYVIPLAGIANVPLGQLIGVEITHSTAGKSPLIKGVMLTGQILPLEQEFTD